MKLQVIGRSIIKEEPGKSYKARVARIEKTLSPEEVVEVGALIEAAGEMRDLLKVLVDPRTPPADIGIAVYEAQKLLCSNYWME